MIFVTVGTEKYPFDRLVKKVDQLKGKGLIRDKIFIQTGSSRCKPDFCEWANFIPFAIMMEMMKKARIIITHGGPGSIMPVVYNQKVPIVVSRLKKYGEVVDDHQVSFTEKLAEKAYILAVVEIEELEQKIRNYGKLVKRLKSLQKKEKSPEEKATSFAQAMEELCQKLIKEEKL